MPDAGVRLSLDVDTAYHDTHADAMLPDPRPRKFRFRTSRRTLVIRSLAKAMVSCSADSDPHSFVVRGLPSGVRVVLVKEPRSTGRPLRIRRGPEKGGTAGQDLGSAIDQRAFAPGARARALLRGKELAASDLSVAGGTYSAAQAQAVLDGITRQGLDEHVREGHLLAVPGPSDGLRYPTFQFTPEGVLPGLKKVQEALPTRNPWAVLNFLVRPDDRLDGQKPIDVLSRGEVDRVISAARAMGVQGG